MSAGRGLHALRFLRGVHPVEWVYLALGLLLVWRHFFFFDDAFVYFRYVDNWLHLDLGLVYNEGEYVEGYSSPLWLLLLAALRATGLGWSAIVRGTALAGFACFWWLAVRVDRRLSPSGATSNLPLAVLCGLYGVSTWFSSGAETPLVQVLAPAYALFALSPGSLPLQLLVALSPLVRHELAASFGVALAWAWWSGRRFPLRLAALGAGAAAAWTLFRAVYYADLLPNTFYLKNEFDPAQGLVYLRDTADPYRLWALALIFPALAFALRARGARPRPGPRAFALLAALPVALYAVAIGGTSTHYRYLAFPVCLALFATGGLAERALLRFAPGAARRAAPLLGLLVAAYAASLRPPQLDAPRFNIDKIGDAAYHRWRIDPGGGFEAKTHPGAMRAWRERRPVFAYRDVRVAGWCARAWEHFDSRVVHRFGLTDAVLARVSGGSWRPGHKRGLGPLAEDLARLQREALAAGETPGPDFYRRAVRAGRAPPWIVENATALDLIARKVYNRRDPLENAALALRFPGAIRAPASALE